MLQPQPEFFEFAVDISILESHVNLGAGSMIWGKKIIILKEEGVDCASDYQDLGYITFQEGHLSSIGMQLFMELIAFDFIKIEAA